MNKIQIIKMGNKIACIWTCAQSLPLKTIRTPAMSLKAKRTPNDHYKKTNMATPMAKSHVVEASIKII